MATKRSQPQGGDDNNELIVILGSVLLIFVLWMMFHTALSTVILAVRQGEAWVISIFTRELDPLREWIRLKPRSQVTAGDLAQISTMVGKYTRWLVTPLLMGIGIYFMFKSPTERFRTVHTEVSLPKTVADLYPWMKISVKHDFTTMPLDSGPWATAMTERQFVRKYKLKDEQGGLDRNRAAAAFIKQLGSMWVGYDSLKPHMKALFALFAVRANKDFKTGDRLLKQLANSAASPSGEVDYTGVDELAAKYMDSKVVQTVLAHHAYEHTVLMQLLERARGGELGKDYLPPNWFLWIKGVDRRLWYGLADVGRRTPHPESAGVFAHWLTEKTRKKKLQMPYVVNAVDGLVAELAKFTNDDDDFESGIGDTDELMEFESLPAAPRLPSPEEAELAFKTGRTYQLPVPPQLASSK